MKKTLIMALVVFIVLGVSAIAFADPVTFSGSLAYQFRQNTNTNSADQDNSIFKFTLNGSAKLVDNVSLYFRVGGETFNNAKAATGDFNGRTYGVGQYGVGYVGGNDKNNAALDQFGINYTKSGWNYKVGRQATTIDDGLLYDSSGFFGRYAFADGLTASGKTGNTNITALVLQEDRYGQNNDNKLYALSANANVTDNWNIGATFATYHFNNGSSGGNAHSAVWASIAPINTSSPNYLSANTKYTFGKAAINGTYAKTSASIENKAYDYGISYNFDPKNSVSINPFKVEAYGDMNGMTTFDNGMKGTYYGFNHQFDKATVLNFFYKDETGLYDGGLKHTSFRTTISYSF